MNFSVGIILYFPTDENILQIKTLNALNIPVYIYDNTDDLEITKKNESLFSSLETFHYFTNISNEGMSTALNRLCNIAIQNNHDYIITLDQDSIFEISEIQKFIFKIKDILSKEKNIGIFGPKIIYEDKSNDTEVNNKEYEIVDFIITSGSAVNLKVFKEIRGFDEKYFIDRVDTDYCKRLLTNGYKIIRINDVILNQRLGDLAINFFGKTYFTHSTLRHYYLSRNRFYYNKKYFANIKKVCLNLFGVFKHVLNIIFFEDEKDQKLRKVVEGYLDYRSNKMYKYTR